ncbi:MAG TPA: M57 family metalloprotease [Pyrinomonadaceae bacterium]|nr:M57 family metalloprotease [Pyrinomonadaceae bacterium]
MDVRKCFVSCLALCLGCSLTATAQNVVSVKSQNFCGMEAAMARLSPEQRKAMLDSAIRPLAPAAEILLYLHFPPAGGTLIRPGNANSTGFISPIVPGNRICPASSLTQAQKDRVVEQVNEDFSPFNIRVTIDYQEFLNYPFAQKLIHIITTTPQVIGQGSGTGGVAPFIGIGTLMPSNPSFSFATALGDDPFYVANVVSHEVGHTLGLAHQSLYNDSCSLLTEYHPNIGTGPLSFSIIMGDATDPGISNWYSQECSHPTYGTPLHDFEVISSQVVLKADEFPEVPGSTPLAPAVTLPVSGILGQAGDADVIRVELPADGTLLVTTDNIDVEVSTFETDGTPIATFNDPELPIVFFPVTAGPKDVRIRAASNANMDAQFMTGSYTLQERLVPTAASVSVSGLVASYGGAPIYGAVLKLTGPAGIVGIARSNPFGYFHIENVPSGGNYVIETRHKLYQFQPVLIDVGDEISGLNIVSNATELTQR